MQWVLFLRGVLGFLSEGVPLVVAIESSLGSSGLSGLRNSLGELSSRVHSGESFLSVLADVSGVGVLQPFQSVAVVPDLVLVLGYVVDYLEVLNAERARLLKVLRYPLILLVSVLGCGGVVFGVVLPSYAGLLQSVMPVLPGFVQVLFQHSDAMVWVLGGGLFVLCCVLMGLSVWLWGRFRSVMALSQFYFVSGVLLSSGYPLQRVLSVGLDMAEVRDNVTYFLVQFESSGQFVASWESAFKVAPESMGMLSHYHSKSNLSGFFLSQSQVVQAGGFGEVRRVVGMVQPALMGVLAVLVFLSIFIAFMPMLYSGYLI